MCTELKYLMGTSPLGEMRPVLLVNAGERSLKRSQLRPDVRRSIFPSHQATLGMCRLPPFEFDIPYGPPEFGRVLHWTGQREPDGWSLLPMNRGHVLAFSGSALRL